MITPEACVHVVDDDKSVLESLALLFKSVDLPAKTYASPEKFLDSYVYDHPSCLVLDIRMPHMGGLQLQDRIRANGWEAGIVMMSGHADVSLAVRAMRNGAITLLEKPFNQQDMIDAVNETLEAQCAGWEERQRLEQIRSLVGQLTDRERDVMALLARGLSNKEIGRELGISHRTAEIHRANLLKKLGINSPLELPRIADI